MGTSHSIGVAIATGLVVTLAAYLIGSIPWAYLIVRFVTGEDITTHGTGNVGAMNVRRTTGSWGWFTVAMVADAAKGFVPTFLASTYVTGTSPIAALAPMLAVLGSVLGHNYSVWIAIKHRRFGRTGKGLATGGGALLAYDWRYWVAAVIVGLLVLAVTRYMMAGQVAGAWALPAYAIVTHRSDWPFALLIAALVYSAHHARFMGLLAGREPKFYINDGTGPRG